MGKIFKSLEEVKRTYFPLQEECTGCHKWFERLKISVRRSIINTIAKIVLATIFGDAIKTVRHKMNNLRERLIEYIKSDITIGCDCECCQEARGLLVDLQKTCKHILDEDGETWHTECGRESVLSFYDAPTTPSECGYKYCHYCGALIETVINE
ncbi:MAG: hypothetical protein PHV98_00805 [Candidatus Omnitrophica bacterium]|nr:hypothetical protein [Candidatus Omnitrophota bacterium]